MTIVTRVAQAMQAVLGKTADALARRVGFIRRQRAFSGSQFVQGLVFGWMADPDASLDSLCQALAAVGVRISPQGLDRRWSKEAGEFVRQVLEQATAQVVQAQSVPLSIVEKFNGIHVDDSSQITLPPELAEQWQGCNGASLKLHVRWDLRRGELAQVHLGPGRQHDQAGPLPDAELPAGALQLHDLGFFNLEQLRAQGERGVYHVCRPKAHCVFYDEQGQEWTLEAFLHQQDADQVDVTIQLGKHERLPQRLLAQRVPEQVAAQRRHKLYAQEKKHGRTPSQRRLALCDWWVLVTNCPPELLTLEEALVLARVRWQIELLFKFWKSHARLAQWRTSNSARILCEVYAKLIGVIIQHWIWITGTWQIPDRSLFKAGQTLKKHATHLAIALASGVRRRLCQAIQAIHGCLQAGCRMNKSQQAPRTFQLLLELSEETLS